MNKAEKDLPKTLNRKEVFHGRVFQVTTDTIQEGDIIYDRDVVHHPGSAVIVPVFDDGTVALVRQYRHPATRYLLEVPAGTLNRGEDPAAGAARELEEELGVSATGMTKLVEFYVSPGFCEEKMWLYLATGLTETAQRLDADEILQIVRLPLIRALEMVKEGEIEDAKTIIGLTLAAARLGTDHGLPND